ncbi:MAG: SET domain-containing protein [Pirellulales bacterium]
MTAAYTSPKLRLNESRAHGKCLIARQPIEAGELLVVWNGDVLTFDELADLPDEFCAHIVQIEEDQFLVSRPPWPDADYVNHACDPNAILQNAKTLVAARPIDVDEEITYDYATSDSSPYDDFTCRCGMSLCRGQVTVDDWKKSELQNRYDQGFSPYLLRRMKATRDNGSMNPTE